MDKGIPWILAGLGVLAYGGLRALTARPRLVEPVLVMGDSLAVGLGQALRRVRDASVEARVGEPPNLTRARALRRLALHPEARTVVLWTGANWLGRRSAAEIAAEVRTVVRMLRATGRQVVIMALPEHVAGAARVNALLRPHVETDAPRAMIAPDGLHYTLAGYRAIAGRL